MKAYLIANLLVQVLVSIYPPLPDELNLSECTLEPAQALVVKLQSRLSEPTFKSF